MTVRQQQSGMSPALRRRGQTLPDLLFVSAESLAVDVLGGVLTRERVRAVTKEASEQLNVPAAVARRGLYMLVARNPGLLSVESAAALEAQVSAFALFAPVSHTSLWLLDGDGEACVARAGAVVPARQLRRIVQRVVEGAKPRAGPEKTLAAVPILRWDRPWGALVFEPTPRASGRAREYAEDAADALAPLVERRLLLGETLQAAEPLLRGADRRIARLGFDIHDGPLQDLSLLLAELSVFERQAQKLVEDPVARRILERRIADLRAITQEAGDDLREIVSAVCVDIGSLYGTLERAVNHFERRSGIAAKLVIEGDVDATTHSQRIALGRVAEEALANIREHSRASHVDILLRRKAGLLELRVIDDGRGFNVGRAMRRATRDRRIGLVAMNERVSLLGGRLEIVSRPGGPSTVSAYLPAWAPVDATADSGRAPA